jgi:REP-associated tyrosine transposase
VHDQNLIYQTLRSGIAAIRDETDFQRHVDYIHYNPVKHGLASSPIDWPYSSFRRYVEAGTYPPDWGRDGIDYEGIGHE